MDQCLSAACEEREWGGVSKHKGLDPGWKKTGIDNVRGDMRDLNVRDEAARDREKWRSV